MNRTFYIAVFIISLINSKIFSEENILSENFIKKHKNYNQYSFESEAEKKISSVEKLKNQKKFEDAISEIHTILKIYPLPKAYYILGNIYMDLKNYNLAETAYKLALIDRSYSKAYLHYNLACLYSLIKNENEAFLNLKEALISGYPHLDFINTDKDLENLRKSNKWPEFKNKFIKLNFSKNLIDTYNIDDTGKTELFLCKNNVAIKSSYRSSTLDGSCCRADGDNPKNNYYYGTWRTIENQIIVIYYKVCGYRGNLPPKPNEGAPADCVNKRNCSLTQECINMKFNNYIDFDLVDTNQRKYKLERNNHKIACDIKSVA